jgi:hypothetical protein
VVGEGADVVDGADDVVFGAGGEDQRVGGLADALLLRRQQLGRPEVLEGLDDAAVGLGARAVHGWITSWRTHLSSVYERDLIVLVTIPACARKGSDPIEGWLRVVAGEGSDPSEGLVEGSARGPIRDP